MGLDMFAYKVPKKDVRGDFKFKRSKNVIEIDYWRKHHDLHGWFENLYLSKGGNETFNCIPLKLELEDLDQLEYDIKIEIYHILQVFSLEIILLMMKVINMTLNLSKKHAKQ